MLEASTKPDIALSRGLMINHGGTFTLSNIRLTIGPDGVSAEAPTVTIAIAVTPFWLEISP